MSFLDQVLDWNSEYFRVFTQSYISIVAASESKLGKISFEYLQSLYKASLAMTQYRMAVADYRRVMDEKLERMKSQLALL